MLKKTGIPVYQIIVLFSMFLNVVFKCYTPQERWYRRHDAINLFKMLRCVSLRADVPPEKAQAHRKRVYAPGDQKFFLRLGLIRTRIQNYNT